MPAHSRLALAGLLAGGLGACSYEAFWYTSERYGSAKPVNVRLACRDTYQVFDRPDRSTLLVVTSPVTELVACSDRATPLLPVRQREVATIFLAESTGRPLCRLTGDVEVTDLHREFTYACPAPAPSPVPYPAHGRR